MSISTKEMMLVSDIKDQNNIQVLKTKDTTHFEDMFQISGKKLLIRRDLCISLTTGTSYWIVQTGQDGGKLIEKINAYDKGKGKKTAFEQAVGECRSKREKKYKKDKYREGRTNAIDPKNDPYPPPMLAETKEKTKITFPCFAQRKLDGNRCMAKVTLDKKTGSPTKVEMYSRSGNFFQGLPHIVGKLIDMASMLILADPKNSKNLLMDQGKPCLDANFIIFDGELFTLEYPFQELNGVLRLDDLDPDDYEKDSGDHLKALKNRERKAKMQLWVYDIAVPRVPQYKRAKLLTDICEMASVPCGDITSTAKKNPVVLEPYETIKDQEELDKFHASSVEQGFEGTIARMWEAGYLFKKRSKELVKIKDFQDEEFKVTGMIANDFLPGTGKFVCEFTNTDGEKDTFDAMPMGTMSERRSMFDLWTFEPDKVIGKMVNVKFHTKFPNGKPRFGVARVRDEL